MKLKYSLFSKTGRITKVSMEGAALKLVIAMDGGGEAVVELSPEDQNAIRPHLQPPAPRRSGV